MNDVLMAAMQIRIESADRQFKKLVEENAEVRKCLTEFDLRHDADQAEIARLTAALAEAEARSAALVAGAKAEGMREAAGLIPACGQCGGQETILAAAAAKEAKP